MSCEVLVVDAEHTGEMPAGEEDDALYKSLILDGIRGVTPLIGNVHSYQLPLDPLTGRRPRYVESDLVLAQGSPTGNPEQQRQYELEHQVYPAYDLVVTRHGNAMQDQASDYAFCAEEPEGVVLEALALLGIKRLVYAEKETFHSNVTNLLGLDLSANSPYTVPRLRDYLTRLLAGERVSLSRRIRRYRAMACVTVERATGVKGLPAELPSFEPLGPEYSRQLGLPDNAMTKVWSLKQFGPLGFYGEVVVPADD